jgi:hypothetical protein
LFTNLGSWIKEFPRFTFSYFHCSVLETCDVVRLCSLSWKLLVTIWFSNATWKAFRTVTRRVSSVTLVLYVFTCNVYIFQYYMEGLSNVLKMKNNELWLEKKVISDKPNKQRNIKKKLIILLARTVLK